MKIEKERGRPRLFFQFSIQFRSTTREGNDFAGKYSLYLAVADREGDLAPVGKQEQPLHFTAEQKAKLEGKLMGQQIQILVRGGEQTISVVIRDDVGGAIGVGKAKVRPDA